MSWKCSEASAGQLVTSHLFECGRQNEKYIYLDFAWISEAGSWIECWGNIGLAAVVLVVRPFFMSLRLYERVVWRMAALIVRDDREGAARLNAWK